MLFGNKKMHIMLCGLKMFLLKIWIICLKQLEFLQVAVIVPV